MGLLMKLYNELYMVLNYIVQVIEFKLFGLKPIDVENIEGKTVLVTGGNSGIGKALSFQFAKRKAKVVIACRNIQEGSLIVEEIKSKTGNENVEFLQLDLSDMSSVRKFSGEVRKKYLSVHILVNNAGIYNIENKDLKTKDGFEANFGVNHLGHFLMTNLILDSLKNAAPSRIVILSSSNLVRSEIDYKNLMLNNPNKVTQSGYDNSKMANALFGKELAKRLVGTGVTTYTLCPGFVATNLFRNIHPIKKIILSTGLRLFGLTSEEGTKTALYCALSKVCAYESGQFYRFSRIHHTLRKLIDKENAEKMWTESAKLVKL